MDIEPTFKGYIEDENDALLILQATLDGLLKHIPRRPYEIERPYLITSGSIFVFIEEVSGIKRWTDGVSWSPSRISGKFLIYRELDKSVNHLSSNSSSNSNSAVAAAMNANSKKAKTETNERSSSCSKIKLPPILSTPISTCSSFSSNISPKSTSPPTTASTSPSPPQSANSNSTGILSLSNHHNTNGKYTGFVKKTLSVKLKNNSKNTMETLHMVSYYNLDELQKDLLVRPSSSDFFSKIHPCQELLIAMENTALGNSNKNSSTLQMSSSVNSPLFTTQKLKINIMNKNNIPHSNPNSLSNSNTVPNNISTAGSIIPGEIHLSQQQQQGPQQGRSEQLDQQQQQQQQHQQHQQQPQQPQQPLQFVKRQSFNSIYQSDDSLSSSYMANATATATANAKTSTTTTTNANVNTNSTTSATHFQPIAPSPKSFVYQSASPCQQQQPNFVQPTTSQPASYYSSRNHSLPHSYYQPNTSIPIEPNSNSNSNSSSNSSLHGSSVQLYPINAHLPYYQNTSNIIPFSNNNINYPTQSNVHVPSNTNSNSNTSINGNVGGNELGVMMSPSLRNNYANFSNYTSQPTPLPTIHQPPPLYQHAPQQQHSIPFFQHQMALHHPPPQIQTYAQPHNVGPPPLQFSNSLINATPFLRHPSPTGTSSAISNPSSAGSNTQPYLMKIGSSANPMENQNTALPQ